MDFSVTGVIGTEEGVLRTTKVMVIEPRKSEETQVFYPLALAGSRSRVSKSVAPTARSGSNEPSATVRERLHGRHYPGRRE